MSFSLFLHLVGFEGFGYLSSRIFPQKRKEEGGKRKESLRIEIGFAYNCDPCRLGSNGRISDSAGELNYINERTSRLTPLISLSLTLYIADRYLYGSCYSKSISPCRFSLRSSGSFLLLVGVRFFIITSELNLCPFFLV